jgi:hypothetical protein
MTLLYLDQSPIHGVGVFSGVDLAARTHLPVPYFKKPVDDDHDSFEGDLFPAFPFRYLNHHTDPNSEVVEYDNILYLVILKDVAANHELTIDYGDQYEWEQA